MVAPTVAQPVITDAPQRHVVYQHFVVAEDEIATTMQRAFGALYQFIGESHVIPAGPPFTMYSSMQPPWQMDVCAPVAGPVTPTAEFLYMELPAGRVVSMTHVGPYEEIGPAYELVQSFIRDKGLTIVGPPREIYLSPPETPPDQIQTIIEWPIE